MMIGAETDTPGIYTAPCRKRAGGPSSPGGPPALPSVTAAAACPRSHPPRHPSPATPHRVDDGQPAEELRHDGLESAARGGIVAATVRPHVDSRRDGLRPNWRTEGKENARMG